MVFDQTHKLLLINTMSKVKHLKDAGLVSPEAISRSDVETLSTIFNFDVKVAKAVLNAAKRLSKKRAACDDDSIAPPSNKRMRGSADLPVIQTPAELEASLQLSISPMTADELDHVVLRTSRPPLLLTFAYSLLEFTMPEQPQSSRLSIAQAVVSASSRAKAVNIGLGKKGEDGQEQAWGDGQPTVKVLGRDIKVLRRWGYEWNKSDQQVALWALDMEQLKQLNGPLTFAFSEHSGGETAGLPIHSPQSAQSYILRAFESLPRQADQDDKMTDINDQGGGCESIRALMRNRRMAAAMTREKEENLAKLLKSLRLLFESWASVLTKDELDKRAWSWYLRVRPEVDYGVAGWGAKGEVKLKDILDLRREG